MTHAATVQPVAAAPDPHAAFRHLCAIGFLAYCSYAICRTPLLPLFARDLGATPAMVGFVVGVSTLTGILVKLPAGAWSDVLGRRPMLSRPVDRPGEGRQQGAGPNGPGRHAVAVSRRRAGRCDGSRCRSVRALFEVEDKTFAQAGRVGLWTKADSVTRFDDLTVASR